MNENTFLRGTKSTVSLELSADSTECCVCVCEVITGPEGVSQRIFKPCPSAPY